VEIAAVIVRSVLSTGVPQLIEAAILAAADPVFIAESRCAVAERRIASGPALRLTASGYEARQDGDRTQVRRTAPKTDLNSSPAAPSQPLVSMNESGQGWSSDGAFMAKNLAKAPQVSGDLRVR